MLYQCRISELWNRSTRHRKAQALNCDSTTGLGRTLTHGCCDSPLIRAAAWAAPEKDPNPESRSLGPRPESHGFRAKNTLSLKSVPIFHKPWKPQALRITRNRQNLMSPEPFRVGSGSSRRRCRRRRRSCSISSCRRRRSSRRRRRSGRRRSSSSSSSSS